MQNMLPNVETELEKDWWNGVQMREVNDTEKFT